ncbi:BTB/POZ domain-containing protein 3-like [Sitodiplosis mosellana]|uniref:BTB/POZ domain-containing protein 3-like n=1 Tax=Sitodiplosis mosellana TaxID=263140 RepID=UPI002443F05E|nr:BTB/POZ domain-containing protein 3-like [Sitodiplosis mosellana]
MYLDTELADVKFVCTNDDESQLVPAHKNILSSQSPVFRAMFYGKLKEKDKVEIPDATVAGFKEFLQFFYLGEVTLTMENIEEVARLADKYDMLGRLNNYAATFINKLTMDNMCWGYQLAIIIKHEQLKAYCEKHICTFTGDLFKSATFQHCDQKTLKQILELETLMCDEIDIF